MSAIKPSHETCFLINSHCFMTVCLGFVAWHIYPDSAKYWGAGVLSVLMWFGAVGFAMVAIKRIFAQWRKNKQIHAMLKKGDAPHGATLADQERLKSSGAMYED